MTYFLLLTYMYTSWIIILLYLRRIGFFRAAVEVLSKTTTAKNCTCPGAKMARTSLLATLIQPLFFPPPRVGKGAIPLSIRLQKKVRTHLEKIWRYRTFFVPRLLLVQYSGEQLQKRKGDKEAEKVHRSPGPPDDGDTEEDSFYYIGSRYYIT